MLKTLCFSSGLFLLSLTASASESMEINDAWIPQAPPVAKMHAGYLQVKNATSQAIVIVAAQSSAYGSVEIHKTVTEGGMARMIKQDELAVPAGKEIKFERGGLHLMLMNPKLPLKIDDKVAIKLLTKDNQAVTFTATVKAATLGEHDHSHHNH